MRGSGIASERILMPCQDIVGGTANTGRLAPIPREMPAYSRRSLTHVFHVFFWNGNHISGIYLAGFELKYMLLAEPSTRYLTVHQQDGYSPYTLTAYQFQHQTLVRDVGDRNVAVRNPRPPNAMRS